MRLSSRISIWNRAQSTNGGIWVKMVCSNVFNCPCTKRPHDHPPGKWLLLSAHSLSSSPASQHQVPVKGDIFSSHGHDRISNWEKAPPTNFYSQDTGSNVTSPSVDQIMKCRLIISKRDNSSSRKILKTSRLIWDWKGLNPVHLTLLDTSRVSTKCLASIIQIYRKLAPKKKKKNKKNITARFKCITAAEYGPEREEIINYNN